MKPEQNFDGPVDQGGEIVASTDVDDFVPKYGFELQRSEV